MTRIRFFSRHCSRCEVLRKAGAFISQLTCATLYLYGSGLCTPGMLCRNRHLVQGRPTCKKRRAQETSKCLLSVGCRFK
jgi:hypothetical protein